MADELAGHLHRPNTRWESKWPEHPAGSVLMTTNNLGFREDEDTPAHAPEGVSRILVTGDSHIDGVANNAETFPNRLEDLLSARENGAVFEVLNGGTGYHGPHNYLGFLRRFLDLEPDTYVVVVYSGNDLLEALQGAESRGRVHIPDRPPEYYDKLQRAAAREMMEVRRLCRREGIELMVMLLPTSFDVQAELDPEAAALLEEVLELGWNDLAINHDVGRQLLGALARAGVETIDLLPELHDGGEELFWKKDEHLNVAGHERLAQVLFERM